MAYRLLEKDKKLKITLFIKKYCLLLCFIAASLNCWSLEVQITGVHSSLHKEILQLHSMKQLTQADQQTTHPIIQLLNQAKREIENVLKSNGYYHYSLDGQLLTVKNQNIANFSIALGKSTLVSSVKINLEGLEGNQRLLDKLNNANKIKQGKTLNHSQYEDTKQALLDVLFKQGYLNAHYITSEIQIDRSKHSAKIVFLLQSGPQFKFGAVTFIDTIYNSDYLQGYVPFKPGDPYRPAKLDKLRKHLFDANLFSKVKLEPLRNKQNSDDLTVPILVKTQAKPTNRYTGNIGYGSDTQVRGGLGWHHKRSGRGHQINANLQAAKIRKVIDFNYMIPGKRPISDAYVLDSKLKEERIKDKFSRNLELGVTKTYKIDHLKFIYATSYFSEIYRALPTDSKQNARFVIPKFKVVWRDREIESQRLLSGKKLEFVARAGSKALFSSADFIRAKVKGRWVLPIIRQHTRLNLLGAAGILRTNDFERIPLTLRYFTGGDTTVRGFSYQSLGPRRVDASGKSIVIGGKRLILASAEVERDITDNISAAIFIDSGNASNHWSMSLAKSIGTGVRYQSPIGPIKLDIAKPITSHDKKRVRLHLTFGLDL